MAITSNVFKTKLNDTDINGGTIDDAVISGSEIVPTDLTVTSEVTNFPAASNGEWFLVTTSDGNPAWIGGAAGAGFVVNDGDLLICVADTIGGTYVAVGDNWNIQRRLINNPDGYRSVEIASNTSAPTITNGYYWLNNVMYVVENSVSIKPVLSNQIASDTETVTGTATDKVTTPANITAKMAAPGAIGETASNTIRGYPKRITKTETGALSLAECSGTIINNYGQTADMTLTFDAACDQINCKFEVVTTGYAVYLKAAANDKFYHDGIALDDADKIGIALPTLGDHVWIEGMRTGEATWDLRSTSGIGAWADSGV